MANEASFRCGLKNIDITFEQCQSDFVDANAMEWDATDEQRANPCFACPDGCRYRVAMAQRRVPTPREVRDQLKTYRVIPRKVKARDLVFHVPPYLLVHEYASAARVGDLA